MKKVMILASLLVLSCSAGHSRKSKEPLDCDLVFATADISKASDVANDTINLLITEPFDWKVATNLENKNGEDLIICVVKLLAEDIPDIGTTNPMVATAKKNIDTYLGEKLK